MKRSRIRCQSFAAFLRNFTCRGLPEGHK
jgi:hypothetical protein